MENEATLEQRPTLKPEIDDAAKLDKNFEQLAFVHYLIAFFTAAKVFLGLPLMLPGYAGMSQGGAAADQVPEWFLVVVKAVAILYNVPEFEKDPLFVALVLFVVGASIVAISVVHGSFLVWIGWCIKKRKRFKTVLYFSWMDVLYVPFGLLLSILVIVFFRRDDVRSAFGVPPRAKNGN
ncbi:MAG: hypothetical protein GY822_17980 [Deltaproteobacteria bacterium]|nr:hypothetical protein [Deltaproteobacteria bacterium]